MDNKSITLLLNQNLETVKKSVEVMFSDIKSKVVKVKEENYDLKRSLQFFQDEIVELKQTETIKITW